MDYSGSEEMVLKMKISSATLLLLHSFALNIFPVRGGFQSGPRTGNAYAGSIAYDPSSNQIYVSGATYETQGASEPNSQTSCFLGSLSLPDLEWIDQKSFGSPDIQESCTAIALSTSSAIVVGSTLKGGLYTNQGTNNAQQYGFVMNVGLKENEIGSALSGVSLQNFRVQSPISVTTHGSQVFVSSVHADEYSRRDTASEEYIAPTYGAIIQEYTLDGSTLKRGWMQQVSETHATNVYVGGSLVKQNSLLVVGSTTGEKSWQDGYVTRHDLETGDLADTKAHTYIMWGDMITGICDDQNDPDSFYVVGTSRTDDNLSPVLTKMSLATLSSIWVKSLPPTSADDQDSAKAYGLACQVSGDVVYAAGTVEDSAHLENEESLGDEDIFVAQFEVESGALNWIRQVGSSGKDTLAHGGGLAVDSTGNAIVYGSTKGSLFREKAGESYSDIFVVALEKSDGSNVIPSDGSKDGKVALEKPDGSNVIPSDESKDGKGHDGGSSTIQGADTGSTTGFTNDEDQDSPTGFWIVLYCILLLSLLIGLVVGQMMMINDLGDGTETNAEANRKYRLRKNLAPYRDIV